MGIFPTGDFELEISNWEFRTGNFKLGIFRIWNLPIKWNTVILNIFIHINF